MSNSQNTIKKNPLEINSFVRISECNMIVTGPDVDTKTGDIVSIEVPNVGPYGITLGPDKSGQGALIVSWSKLPDGRYGTVQRHGGVHIGDAILMVNNSSLAHISHRDASRIIQDGNILRKHLTFCSSREYYRLKSSRAFSTGQGIAEYLKNNSNSVDDPPFTSFISRYRINGEGQDKVVEYEIACQLRTISERLHTQQVYKWAIWKRYSDFVTVHKELTKFLGWQMEKIRVPPSHSMTWDKFNEAFIQKRKLELNDYWKIIMELPRASDFTRTTNSSELRKFLDVDNVIRSQDSANEGGAAFAGLNDNMSIRACVTGDARSDVANGKRASVRRGSVNMRGQSLRRASLRGSAVASGSSINSNSSGNTRPTPNVTLDEDMKQTSTGVPPPPPPISSSKPISPVSTVTLSQASNPKFAKYDKMRKTGLPDGAIRQKMMMDGISDNEISIYLGEGMNGMSISPPPSVASPVPGPPLGPPPPPMGAPPPPANVPHHMTPSETAGNFENDERYRIYNTMKKNRLPDGAIRQKMFIDGFSDQEIDTYLAS